MHTRQEKKWFRKKIEFLECWFEQQDHWSPAEQEVPTQSFKPKLVFFIHHQGYQIRKTTFSLDFGQDDPKWLGPSLEDPHNGAPVPTEPKIPGLFPMRILNLYLDTI